MEDRNRIKSIAKTFFLVLTMSILFLSYVGAEIVSHTPAEVTPGTFSVGNFSFQGSVGIGTNNPVSILDIGDPYDNNYITIERNGNSNGGLRWYRPVGPAIDAQIYVDIGENLIINNSFGDPIALMGGNVGVGTTIPSYNLDVSGTGRFIDNLNLDNDLLFTGAGDVIDFSDDVGPKIMYYGSSYYSGIEGLTKYEVSSNYFRWYDASSPPDDGTSDIMELNTDTGALAVSGALTAATIDTGNGAKEIGDSIGNCASTDVHKGDGGCEAESSLSVSYASTAGRAYPYRSDGSALNFYWSGQGGQPTWLWGGNDGTNMYVYNPSNFNVNYATNAGYASNAGTLDTLDSSQFLRSDAYNSVFYGTSMEARINGGTPFVDWSNDLSIDYDIRIMLTGDDSLTTYGGTLSTGSDRRLKHSISNITSALEKINKINGVYFYWNNESYGNTTKRQVGVIAQDVEKVFPELIHDTEGNNSFKTVDYQQLIAPLINAVKELKTEKDMEKYDYESEIDVLKKENTQLKLALCSINQTFEFCN